MLRRLFLLLISVLLLAGCQQLSTQDQTARVTICDKPGNVIRSELEKPARGYPYPFNVYLPPCYETDIDRRYAVLYLLPGRGSGPGAWLGAGAAQAADEAILSGDVPPFIIIATENTEADPYAGTILHELIPYVESQYRIQTDRDHRAVAGASLGGVGAYRLAFGHPDQFASVGMFGSGVNYGEEEQFRRWLQALPSDQIPRVLFNCGEGDPLMLQRAQVTIALLDEVNIPSTTIFSAGEHTYSYWVSNLPEYFRWLAQDW